MQIRRNAKNWLAGSLLLALLAGSPVQGQVELPEALYFSQDGRQLLQGGLPSQGLYDESALRTFELRFAQEDWLAQLAANYSSGVNIAADLIVDGVTYPGVGVRYKGTTSYQRGSLKNPFNIDLQFTDPDQGLMGYETLNLHSSSGDASFVREVLASNIYRRYIPSPKASFVKLLINGQNWGVYVNVQQVNKDLIDEWFPDGRGDRWKIGSTGGGGGGAIRDSVVFEPGGGPGGVPPDSLRGTFGPGGTLPDSLRGQLGPGGGPGGPGGALPGAGATGDTVAFFGPGGGPGGGGFGGGSGALTWLGADTAAYQGIYELQSSRSADPWGALVRLCDVLNNTPLEALAGSLDRVLDIDRALWYIALENILADSDGYNTKGGDYRIFHEEATGRFHPLQYDANEVMGAGGIAILPPPGDSTGVAGGGGFPRGVRGGGPRGGGPQGGGPQGDGTSKDPFEDQDNANRPLISRLLAVPELRQRYIAHYRTILEETLDWEELAPLVEGYRSLIEREVEADPIKRSSFEQFQSTFADIENFVEQRRAYLLSLPEFSRPAPRIEAVSHMPVAAEKRSQAGPGAPLAGEPVQVTARVDLTVPVREVLLHYAPGMAGAFARVPMVEEDNGLFTARIPPQPAGTLVRYYVEARAADEVGTAAFLPEGAEHDVFFYQAEAPVAPSSLVLINELMADNDAFLMDPQEEYEDWIELFNTSDQEVDLSGMYLSDSEANLRKWAFPQGTVIAPGGYLLVWADEDGGDAPGLHASFKLSAGGEMVLLVDADERGNAILDQVAFGEQQTDRSYGRMPDGNGVFEMLSYPTPAGSNLRATAVLEGEGGALPQEFALEQNFPNPFNSHTVIRFALPAASREVELSIYNLAGQKVVTLLRGYLPAGVHQVQWDGRDDRGNPLASGVYLYRLQRGQVERTRRLLLLR